MAAKGSKGSKKNKSPNYYRPNLARAFSDVVIASMNKGQFPFAIMGLCLILLILKMPPEKAYDLAIEILDRLKTLNYLGWILSVVFMFLWYTSSKRLRQKHSDEFDRVGQEKKELQEKLVLRKLDSSNK